MPNLIYCCEEFYRISHRNSKMIECSAKGTHPWKLCYNRRVVGDFYRWKVDKKFSLHGQAKAFVFLNTEEIIGKWYTQIPLFA